MLIFPLKSTFLLFFSLIDSIEFFIKLIKTLLSCSSSPFILLDYFPCDTIKFNLPDANSILEINGDEEQLNRVFINLIKNSIESIHEKKIKNADFKGKIAIDIKDDSDYIYVTIVDNGVGFEKVDKAKMLTPYYTTKKQGTGLGLAIVTKIVNDHNGTILFNSIKNGAKVEIILPK